MSYVESATLAYPPIQMHVEEASTLQKQRLRSDQRLMHSYEATSVGFGVIAIEKEWLTDALRRIADLSNAVGWSPLANFAPPNATAKQHARQAIKALADTDLKASSINASVEEGICIAFRDQQLYADIECFNSGETIVATSKGNGEHQVWQIASGEQLSESVRVIQNFLAARK